VVRITDDGAGYDPAQRRGGHGVTGMRERAALAGGRLRVTSTPGAGTRVELRLGGER
jgi:signal transduction histidine kinase